MAYFKWGSVVGFNNADGFTAFDSTVTGATPNAVMFNPSNASFSDYTGIPYYDTAPASGDVADASYTSLANVLAGKGDPCRLVGLTVAQIRSATPDQWATYMANSQWRMPTDADNQAFSGNHPVNSAYNTTTVSSTGSWTKTSPGLLTFVLSGAEVPAGGIRSNTGAQQTPGADWSYWSSSQNLSNVGAIYHALQTRGPQPINITGHFGRNIRCVPK